MSDTALKNKLRDLRFAFADVVLGLALTKNYQQSPIAVNGKAYPEQVIHIPILMKSIEIFCADLHPLHELIIKNNDCFRDTLKSEIKDFRNDPDVSFFCELNNKLKHNKLDKGHIFVSFGYDDHQTKYSKFDSPIRYLGEDIISFVTDLKEREPSYPSTETLSNSDAVKITMKGASVKKECSLAETEQLMFGVLRQQ